MSGRCQACNVVFQNGDELRLHYASEFHAANVRARVAGSAAMTETEFRRSEQNGVEDSRPIFSCQLCNKTFKSVQTLQAHVKSTEHLIRKEQRILERDSNAASMLSSTSLGSAALGLHRRHKAHLKACRPLHADPLIAVSVPAAEREEDVSEVRCFFCGLQSANIRLNLDHMLQAHQFSVPLVQKCKDIPGLMKYLSLKINGLLCLVCGEQTKSFSSLEALRAHMKQMNHERLVLSPEYADFYEGKLDDGSPAPIVSKAEEGALVLADGKQRIIKREAFLEGVVRPRRENEQQVQERRAITAAAQNEYRVMLKDQRKQSQPERTAQNKLLGRAAVSKNNWDMKMGIKTGLMHPKGFEGDGCN